MDLYKLIDWCVMRKLIWLMFFASAWSFADPPQPSFDCAKAATSAEQAICGNFILASLDKQISENYLKLKAVYSNNLKKEQLAWLKERNACGANEECLTNSLLARNKSLIFQFAISGSKVTCMTDVKASLEKAINYSKDVSVEREFQEQWYKSYFPFSSSSSLVPEIAVVYAQAGCWNEAIDILKSIESKYPGSYKYMLSQYAILKAYQDGINSANLLISLLSRRYLDGGYEGYAGARMAELLLFQGGSFSDSVNLIYMTNGELSVLDIEYRALAEELVLSGRYSDLKEQAYKTLNMGIILPYLAHLSQTENQKEGRDLLEKFTRKNQNIELIEATKIELGMAYAMVGDLDAAKRSTAIDDSGRYLMAISKCLPLLGSVELRNKLKGEIYKEFSKLPEQSRLSIAGQLAAAFSYADDIEGFKEIILLSTAAPKEQYPIQIAINTFITFAIQQNKLLFAEKAAKELFPYINTEQGRESYLINAKINMLLGRYDLAFEYALNSKNSSHQDRLLMILVSLNPDPYIVSKWINEMPVDGNGKHLVDEGPVQAVSAYLARNNLGFNPAERFRSDDKNILARAWLGYAQGKLNIVPGFETAVLPSVMYTGAPYETRRLLSQFYKGVRPEIIKKMEFPKGASVGK